MLYVLLCIEVFAFVVAPFLDAFYMYVLFAICFYWVFFHTNFHRLFQWTPHVNWIYSKTFICGIYRTLYEHMCFQSRSCVSSDFVISLWNSSSPAPIKRNILGRKTFTSLNKKKKESVKKAWKFIKKISVKPFFFTVPLWFPMKHQKTSGNQKRLMGRNRISNIFWDVAKQCEKYIFFQWKIFIECWNELIEIRLHLKFLGNIFDKETLFPNEVPIRWLKKEWIFTN